MGRLKKCFALLGLGGKGKGWARAFFRLVSSRPAKGEDDAGDEDGGAENPNAEG